MDKNNSLRKVLLIEDSDTDAFMIQKAIQRYSKDTECMRAATLKAGEEILQQGGIDLLLLDLGLPDTSSPKDTYEQIKKWTGKLPVVVMTNLEDHDLAKVMVHEGVADFLNKDLIAKDPKHMEKAIDFSMERHAAGRQLVQDKDEMLRYLSGGYSVSDK